MIFWIALLLISAGGLIWVIRDAEKNPAIMPTMSKEEKQKYDKKIDKIFNAIVISIVALLAIGLVVGKYCSEKALYDILEKL